MIFQRDVIKSGEIVSVVGSHITIRFILYERRSKNIIKDTINRPSSHGIIGAIEHTT